MAMLYSSRSAAVAAVAVCLTAHAARAFVIPPSAGALFSGSESSPSSGGAGHSKASSRSRSSLRMDASAGDLA